MQCNKAVILNNLRRSTFGLPVPAWGNGPGALCLYSNPAVRDGAFFLIYDAIGAFPSAFRLVNSRTNSIIT